MSATDQSAFTRYLAQEPFTIKGVTLRNRIVQAAHGTGYAHGRLTDDLLAYQIARARGGAGLGFAEAGQVHWSSPGAFDLTSDAAVEGLATLADAVKSEGMKLFQQLKHNGPTMIPHDGSAPWGASPVPDPGRSMLARPMSKLMIDEVVAGFGASAARVKEAELDGLEIHAGHGYLFSAFLSPATNHRTDQYGETLENRMRLIVEVLTSIRSAVGDDFVVGARLSPDGLDSHTTSDDIAKVIGLLEDAHLIDFVNLSYGSHYRRNKLIATSREPRGYQVHQVTGDLAKIATVPTMVTGRILTIEDADEILREGNVDLVSMVRALVADPDLPRKSFDGRADEVRPCISCTQGCAGGMTSRGRMGCTVNPTVGNEASSKILRVSSRRRVLIIGGGPAGMEAARECALAGHDVVLHERSDRLGGQLKLVEKSPSRSDSARILAFYVSEMERLSVDVHLTSEFRDVEAIREVGADAVVVATGATPRSDGFQAWRPEGPPPGFERISVLSGWDVLNGALVDGPVLLVDEIGHYESIDVAESLVDAGHAVRHVTRFHNLGFRLPVDYDHVASIHLERLYESDYELYTDSLVTSVTPESATIAPLTAAQKATELEIGTFVFMSGSIPDYEFLDAVELIPGVMVIGDANGPRTLEPAIAEGASIARRLESDWERPRLLRYTM